MEKNQIEIKVDGQHLKGNLIPSKVLPGIEYIKNSERSISGKLHVDIASTKQTLQIIYDYLDKESFEYVVGIFGANNSIAMTEGLVIEYSFDVSKKSKGKNDDKPNYSNLLDNETLRKFIVEDFIFEPLIIDDNIKWKNISINLVEV
ncbi:MAG: hypothetical protein FWB72_05200 [Firmicutes bacterium]|nr:hypothetical protein [Bacillota bacterium]